MKKLIPVICCLIVFCASAWAQTAGSMRGEVLDADGKPIPGATVTVSSPSLIGGTRTAYTNELGVFRFPSIPVGNYSVSVTMQGFETVQVPKVVVSLNTTANVPLTMRMSAMAEQMTVVGETPVIDVTQSGLSSNFKGELLEEVPTQRSFTNLIQVAPGIAASTGDDQGTTDRTVAFGSNQQSNSWNIDGMDLTAPETGSTWMYNTPDAIEEIQIIGVGAPAEFGNHQGAVFNVVTKKGGNATHGTANYFFLDDALTSTNVTVPVEGCPECEHFNVDFARDFTATLGGPIKKDRLWYYGSFQYARDASTPPGNNPDVAEILQQKTNRYDVKLSGLAGTKTEYSGFYHLEDWKSPDSASPFIETSAVYQERGRDHGWGFGTTTTFSNNFLLEARYAGWTTHDLSDSPTGVLEPQFFDYSPEDGGPTRYVGGAYYPFDYKTSRHQANGKATYYAENFLKSQHEFRFGVQYSRGDAITQTAAGVNGYYGYTYYGYNYYVTYQYEDLYFRSYQLPFEYGAVTHDLGFFLDDTITVNDRLTLNVGVRFDHNTGEVPDFRRLAVGTPSISEVGNFVDTGDVIPGEERINWNLVSPRLGFVLQTQEGGKSVLQGSFGVYYDHNVAGNWEYPTPSATPFEIFMCSANCSRTSGVYDIPWYFLDTTGTIDPDIKAPRTLQYSIGYEQQLSDAFAIGAQYVYKDTKDLIGWGIIGGEWEPVLFTDLFTGNQYVLLNQIGAPTYIKGNAPFPEGIPDFSGKTDKGYFQKYHGVVFTFNKRFADNWALSGSYTWSKSTGLNPRPLEQVQFNPFYSSLRGSDPNNWINAEGRLLGDRPHMFRLQAVFMNLPWDLQTSVNADFSSGSPYTRQFQTAFSLLEQGSTRMIMDHDLRKSAFKTIDVSVGKRFPIGHDMQIRVDGTIFNLLNSDNELEFAQLYLDEGENFEPVTWIKPRRLQLRVGFQF